MSCRYTAQGDYICDLVEGLTTTNAAATAQMLALQNTYQQPTKTSAPYTINNRTYVAYKRPLVKNEGDGTCYCVDVTDNSDIGKCTMNYYGDMQCYSKKQPNKQILSSASVPRQCLNGGHMWHSSNNRWNCDTDPTKSDCKNRC